MYTPVDRGIATPACKFIRMIAIGNHYHIDSLRGALLVRDDTSIFRAHYVIFLIIPNFTQKVNRIFSRNLGETDGIVVQKNRLGPFFENYAKMPLSNRQNSGIV